MLRCSSSNLTWRSIWILLLITPKIVQVEIALGSWPCSLQQKPKNKLSIRYPAFQMGCCPHMDLWRWHFFLELVAVDRQRRYGSCLVKCLLSNIHCSILGRIICMGKLCSGRCGAVHGTGSLVGTYQMSPLRGRE